VVRANLSACDRTAARTPTDDADDPRRDARRLRYVWALAACAFTTLVATALLPRLELANIVMLFLLTVVLIALKAGRGPAVLAAFVSVAAFDFCAAAYVVRGERRGTADVRRDACGRVSSSGR
jgi:two-component system sensor histidine kinase KdpD